MKTKFRLSKPRRHKTKGSRVTVALRSGKNPGTHRMGPRNGLEVSEKRKIFTPTGIRTLDLPDRSLPTTQLRLHYQKDKLYYQRFYLPTDVQ